MRWPECDDMCPSSEIRRSKATVSTLNSDFVKGAYHPPLTAMKLAEKKFASAPRCLIIKSTRKVNRSLTNKSTRKKVASGRRSVPRSGGGWQAKGFSFGFLHLVYGSS